MPGKNNFLVLVGTENKKLSHTWLSCQDHLQQLYDTSMTAITQTNAIKTT